ncbi:MAG: PEGA domain-containing protein [Alphaproteobacteria bacterium]|nr:PEGA domain-containing protein [Alphaproteobacteria bacterium]
MRALPLLLLFAPSLALAATGTLEVRAPDAPGEVLLDGFPTGKRAPARLESVPTGDHEVEVEYGCLIGVAEVFVDVGEPTVAELEMVERDGVGTIFVRGLPRGAEVSVDGQPAAGAAEGVRVACGAHEVSVSAPGYEVWTGSTVVTVGKRDELTPDLVAESFDFEPPTPDPVAEEEEEDLDFLDEPDAPKEPARPRTELELLDEPEEEGRRGGRDRGGEAEEDDHFSDMDDPGLDEPAPRFDDPEFDDPDPDFDDTELQDRPDEEEELDDIVPREKPKPAREPLPMRAIGTGAGAAVGLVGLGIGVASTPGYASAKSEYDNIALARGPFDSETLNYEATILNPARARMATGYVIGVAGAGLAAASWLLIPAPDSADLVLLPAPGGLSLSGSF